jgi:hypothetical protein
MSTPGLGVFAAALMMTLATSASTLAGAAPAMSPTGAVKAARSAAAASGPCKPGVGCVRLGKPVSVNLFTINNGGLSCTIHYTVNWGEGPTSGPITVSPNSEVTVSHTYAALGTFTVRALASVDAGSDPACLTVPGGWDHKIEYEVIQQLEAAATLKDIDDLPLKYLSTDQHPYFGGFTRINGTVSIRGAARDRLDFLFLEVSQGNTDAFAFLTDAATSKLINVPFGADHKVSINVSELLFELSTAQAALFNSNLNGPVHLRLVGAAAGDGAQIDKSLGDKQRLVLYKRPNRYEERNASEGGDDWVLPSVRPALVGLTISFPSLKYGDFSNMNGGNFPPHKSHRDGIDVDVKIPGYAARDAAVAHTLLGHLNDPQNGSRIRQVFVTYNKPGGKVFPGRPIPDPFWLAIKDVTLNDGRAARAVIVPDEGHDTHFHWRIAP